jgi:hypothetical protein
VSALIVSKLVFLCSEIGMLSFVFSLRWHLVIWDIGMPYLALCLLRVNWHAQTQVGLSLSPGFSLRVVAYVTPLFGGHIGGTSPGLGSSQSLLLVKFPGFSFLSILGYIGFTPR